eukprot:SAG31_NODE_5576_length_2447_cov_2.667376_1_plen_332_part_00
MQCTPQRTARPRGHAGAGGMLKQVGAAALLLVVVAALAGAEQVVAEDAASAETEVPNIDDWDSEAVGKWVDAMLKDDSKGAEEESWWFFAKPAPKGFADAFVKLGIDGMMLMQMDEDLLTDESLGLSTEQATKLMAKIGEIKARITENPADLWEYRAANRKYVDILGGWTMGAARGPLLWIRMRDYDTVWKPAFHEHGGVQEGETSGGGALGFWISWVLCPDVVVMFAATNFLGSHPVLTSWMLLALGLKQVFTIVAAAKASNPARGLVANYFISSIKCEVGLALTAGFRFCLFPIIPWFLCDFFFYLMIIFAPFVELGRIRGFSQALKQD